MYEAHQEKALLERLSQEYKGKTVLIVGHSNTIPFAVNELLGEPRLQALPETEYNKVFIVSRQAEGNAYFFRLVLELPVAAQFFTAGGGLEQFQGICLNRLSTSFLKASLQPM